MCMCVRFVFHLSAGTGQKDPVLNFRSLTGKAKHSAGDLVTVAGDQLLCKDITKTALKSPFDRDVLQNMESAETLLDYTLSRLGINSDRLLHPVLITEGVCTPNYARGRMSEVAQHTTQDCLEVDMAMMHGCHGASLPSRATLLEFTFKSTRRA